MDKEFCLLEVYEFVFETDKDSFDNNASSEIG